ncbi:MAG TPA: hypothetical protein VEY51_20905 [Chondromyces sp.]|nr:hypothetical protein [Chondromyces sp.]
MRHQRYDKTFIKDYSETPEGYLTVTVPITLWCFSVSAARWNHPNGPATLQNYNRYAKGMSHKDETFRGLKLFVGSPEGNVEISRRRMSISLVKR